MKTNASISIVRPLVLLILLLGTSKFGVSQKSFGVEISYLTGFQDHDLSVLGSSISYEIPHGVQFSALYSKNLKETYWYFNAALGGKYLHSKGIVEPELHYSTNTFNINAMLGTHYKLNNKLGAGLQFVIENNRDFQETTYLKANLWRYYLCAEGSYAISNKLGVSLKYWRSISSNEDVYLIYLPANQISVGLKYHFNEI